MPIAGTAEPRPVETDVFNEALELELKPEETSRVDVPKNVVPRHGATEAPAR